MRSVIETAHTKSAAKNSRASFFFLVALIIYHVSRTNTELHLPIPFTPPNPPLLHRVFHSYKKAHLRVTKPPSTTCLFSQPRPCSNHRIFLFFNASFCSPRYSNNSFKASSLAYAPRILVHTHRRRSPLRQQWHQQHLQPTPLPTLKTCLLSVHHSRTRTVPSSTWARLALSSLSPDSNLEPPPLADTHSRHLLYHHHHTSHPRLHHHRRAPSSALSWRRHKVAQTVPPTRCPQSW